MHAASSHPRRFAIALAAAGTLLAACADEAPVSPLRQPATSAQVTASQESETNTTLATLRRVTARYHDLAAAVDDDFVLLHPCENRPDEGPVGTVYVHMGRLLDGVIDPELPDALIYEPSKNGRAKLVGVEFAMPYALWTETEAPTFLGETFQREDEFGVFALHAWVWRHNPNGMFGESNPRVSCES